jgi:hypothetical protein
MENRQLIESQNKEVDYLARKNLSGFFNLLLKIDMRINPELYKTNLDYKNDTLNLIDRK